MAKSKETPVELPQNTPPIEPSDDEETTPEGADISIGLKPNLGMAPERLIDLTPRDLINQKAQEARDSRKLPPVPGFSPNLKQFIEWAKPLDETQWSHLEGYLYRRWPKIIRQQSSPDNPVHIDIIHKEMLDDGLEEYIIRTHGGGKYKIWINDKDQKTPRGTNKQIIDCGFEIDSSLYEPKPDLLEVDVVAKNNMGFIAQQVAKGKMDSRGNIMQPQQQQNNSDPAALAGEMGKMFQQFMQMYGTMSKDNQAMLSKFITDGNNKKGEGGIETLLLEKLKQDDPNKTTDTMLKMFVAMQPKQDNSMIQLLITQMQESSNKQMELMRLLFTSMNKPVQAEKSDDFIDKFIKYRTAMPELFGGGNPGTIKRDTAEIIIEGVKELGLPALGLISQMIQMRTGIKPIIPVSEQQAQELVQQHQQSQPQQSQGKILPMPQQTQPPVQSNPTGQPTLDPNNLSICQKLLLNYGAMLIRAIKAGQNGAEIADNLDSAKLMLGFDVVGELTKQGKEEILTAMESIPDFWKETGAVYGKPFMEQLVDDFLSTPEEDGEGEGEGEEVENGKGKPA